MAQVGDVSVLLRLAGAGQFKRAAQQASASMTSFGKAAAAAQGNLVALTAGAAALATAAYGMGRAIKGVADASGEFGFEIAKVGAITRASAEDMKLLRNAAIQAGLATQFSPTQAAQGLAELGSAGLNAVSSTQVLVPSLDLAAGGLISVKDAAGSVVSMLSIYQRSSSDAAIITDKLLKITQLTKLQAQDYAASLGKAASKTAIAGQTMDDTLISMGLLRNAGIDASSAATYYARSVVNMSSKEKAWQQMQKLGVSYYDEQTGAARSFIDVTLDLSKALESASPKQKAVAINNIYGARAAGAYTAVANAQVEVQKDGEKVTLRGAAAIAHLRAEMEKSAGAAEEFRKKLLGTYKGSKILLEGTLETMAVVFGEPFKDIFRPMIGAVTDFLNIVTSGFDRLPRAVKLGFAGFTIGGAAIVSAAALAAGAMVALGGAITFLGPAWAAATAAIGPMLAGIGSALLSVLAILGPFLVILGTIGLVVGAVYEANERSLGALGEAWASVTNFIKGLWVGLSEFLTNVWDFTLGGIVSGTGSAFTKVAEIINGLMNKVMKIFAGVADTFGQFLYAAGFEDFASRYSNIKADMMGFDADIGSLLSNVGTEYIAPLAKGVKNFGKIAYKSTAGALIDGINMGVDGLRKILGPAFEEVAKKIEDILPKAAAGPKPPGGGKGPAEESIVEANKRAAAGMEEVRRTRERRKKEREEARKTAAAATASRAQGAAGAVSSGLAGNVGGVVSGVATALGASLGPVAGAALSVVDGLMGASEAGKKLKEDVGMIFAMLAEAFSPVFEALRPLVQALAPLMQIIGLIVEVSFALSLLQPAIWIVGKAMAAIGIIVQTVILGFRAMYIALLEFVEIVTFGAVDFSREITELEAAQRQTRRERQDLIDRFTGEATMDEQRAQRERELAAATREATSAMLNVPAGYKVAHARFGAEVPVMDDFVMRPGQGPVEFSKDDTLVGVKNTGLLGGGGPSIVIQHLEVRANNPSQFFNKLARLANQDNSQGGIGLGGAFQGRP